ncbi:MAG: HAD family hydrolase [Erysipelotrichaceae bacterium]|nr:HAD family hydrolase [Erysipelotrichaceae bacterium]
MIRNIKIIAADIDGTITTSNYITPKRNIEAIENLRKAGYLFGLASGRPVDDLKNKYEIWGLSKQVDFIIGWNGAELYDARKDVKYNYNYLTKQELKEIVDFMRPYEKITSVYLPGIYLASNDSEKALSSSEKTHRKLVIAKSYDEFSAVDNGGIMFRTDIKQMPEIEKVVVEKTKDKNYVGFKTQADLMEFANKNCNKGYALRKYCELNDMSLDECMAFGDTTNDNEILRICNGVCMLNGSDDTKACAKYITDTECDLEGFADFVEKNLL